MALELEVWQAPIVDSEGNIQPGAQVTVFNSDDTLATIYDDLNRTPRSNPFNVGSDALARFYAEPGRYRVQAQVGSAIAVFDDVDLSQKALREDLAGEDGAELVVYKQRTVLERLQDKISVKDYGATGNGVDSDTAFIQAAINDTEENGHGYVYIPTFDEQYRLDAPLEMHLGDIKIFGDKGQQFVHPFTDGTNRQLRKGNLMLDSGVRCALNLGADQTGASGDNPSRNLAMAFTVEGLSVQGVGRTSNAFEWTAVQNGPHRPVSLRDTSAYNCNNGLYVKPAPSGITIMIANLAVEHSTFSFNNKAVFSEGPVFGANFQNNNFEANSEGAVVGLFNGHITISNNMLENVKNPVDLYPESSLRLFARGNYFEFHPTSDFLYRINGTQITSAYDMDIAGDILSGGIPPTQVVFNGRGRVKINTDRYLVKIDNVDGTVITRGSNLVNRQGSFVIDGGFANTDRGFFAHADNGFNSFDDDGSWIHDYPHNEDVSFDVDTPIGKMQAVDLCDGFRVNYGEGIQGKLVVTNFLMKTKDFRATQFPAGLIQARTFGGAFVNGYGNYLDYIANDIVKGEWTLVTTAWKPTNNVASIEFFIAEEFRGSVFVAGSSTKVLGAYVGDGSDSVVEIKPVCPNPVGEISSGSNSNGSWVKYSDGTMVQRRSFSSSTSVDATNEIQGLTIFNQDKPWTYPLEFTGTPTVCANPRQNTNGTFCSVNTRSPTATGVTLVMSSLVSFSSFSAGLDVVAHGRWK